MDRIVSGSHQTIVARTTTIRGGSAVSTTFKYRRLDKNGAAVLLVDHPHRGFETVTIVYQGELEHRDSAGNYGRIGPGDVQWMST